MCYRLGTWHLDPQEGNMLQIRNLALRLESQTIPRMVTHQPKDGHPPEGSMLQTQNLDPPVTYQKDVYYRLGIWKLDLTHKIRTK